MFVDCPLAEFVVDAFATAFGVVGTRVALVDQRQLP